MSEHRREHDFLGEISVPATAYWGIHTARALTNFPISGQPLSSHPCLVAALGAVKQAAVRANRDLGLLPRPLADAIDDAAAEVRTGRLNQEFVVDVVQGGAGTSTNMNANEVIANRALELLGHPRGTYDLVNPNDHVNRSQSTNDVYPTAVRIALVTGLDGLAQALDRLTEAFAVKARLYADLPKVGRTQLQDAVPMTVGQEFGAWAATLAEEQERIRDTRALLLEINLGATAIGTGITTESGYQSLVLRHLTELTGLPVAPAPNLVEATSDTGSLVQASAMLKRTAVKASKICNDLRLLSSGPQAGLAELRLPPRQAGSSLMPGKVNPVIPEMVNQVAFAIAGHDVTITMAAEAGQLQLNAFEPIMAHLLIQGVEWLDHALVALTTHCVTGIEVDRERVTTQSARSVGIVTALAPHLGYTAAADIARATLAGRGTVRDLVVASGTLDAARCDELLRVDHVTGPLAPSSQRQSSGTAPDDLPR